MKENQRYIESCIRDSSEMGDEKVLGLMLDIYINEYDLDPLNVPFLSKRSKEYIKSVIRNRNINRILQ